MSKKEELDQSLEKNGGLPGKKLQPGKAYRRFFEGYSETAVPKPNGKGFSIQRVYTGNHYRQDLEQNRRILLRALYSGGFLLVVYLFISSAILPVGSNSTWYVVLAQVISIPFLFWILISLFSYLTTPRDITIHDYRSSSVSLKKATVGAAIGLGLAALAMLIFILLNSTEDHQIELVSTVKYLVGGLITSSMNWIEKKINYLIIPGLNTHQQS